VTRTKTDAKRWIAWMMLFHDHDVAAGISVASAVAWERTEPWWVWGYAAPVEVKGELKNENRAKTASRYC
jgi:hypothetical protein